MASATADLERGMQTTADMPLRPRSNAFVRSLVDAATVRPFWTALLEMKRARLDHARLASTTSTPTSTPNSAQPRPELAAQIAA